MLELILKYLAPVITAAIGVVGTVIVTRIKSKKTGVAKSAPGMNDCKCIESQRVDANFSVPDDMKGATCYKTRRFDEVRTCVSGIATIDGDKITIDGADVTQTIKGITPIIVNGANIAQGDKIGLVSNIHMSEGRIFVLETKKEKQIEQ